MALIVPGWSPAGCDRTARLVRIRFRVTKLEQTPAVAFDVATATVGRVRSALATTASSGSRSPGSAFVRTKLRRTDTTLVGYECAAGFLIESAWLDDVPRLLLSWSRAFAATSSEARCVARPSRPAGPGSTQAAAILGDLAPRPSRAPPRPPCWRPRRPNGACGSWPNGRPDLSEDVRTLGNTSPSTAHSPR